MRGVRRKGGAGDGDSAALPRIAWPVHHDGEDLIVSVIPSRVAGDNSFRPVDVFANAAQGEDGGAATELVASLTKAASAPGTVAIQGFAAKTPTGNVLTFTLAVSLADLPYPEVGDLPEGDVSDCRLPVGPGVRIFRMAEPDEEDDPAHPDDDPAHPAPPIPLFSTTYLAQTDFGVLALAFATPHVDGAREFAVLFESIAKTCVIQPAASASAT
jgi:hypothetical protein